MLKKVSAIIPPDLLKFLAEMGHGDDIVIADANFPAESLAKRIVRCDGVDTPQLLSAVLSLIPLDSYVKQPVSLMNIPLTREQPSIWKMYEQIIRKHEPASFNCGFALLERFAFYEEAKAAYVVVQSGELATYANIILKKGVVTNENT